ncbi:C4-dicarboxylate ABC transporter substrate-binding protein [Motiliproteus coralliicola]|uniref:C4-dicarboxylate ABC transporter substrate-binding protein n=1 Tax=Motiliproteus coralliicola TaxID=2283196 RepID=A0A369WWB4_9GAMM|nr:TAXI family TRAP transporter solute-binding subunit [Motiliproteus coralliicola]RDE24844.1 C4-dicarboxylate ABC transporter substrate-binding protein [Motiliproteus coralliicola]
MKKWYQHLAGCLLLSPFLLADASAQSKIISLGTGGVTGLYYPAGGAICRLVNENRMEHGIRCAVRSTPGSVSNLQQVDAQQLDLGIAEAGQLHDALQGQGRFAEPLAQLRTLFSLYTEYITVVARKDSGIDSFDDLRGKRINIGPEGSSQRATLQLLMQARGWSLNDFPEVHQLEPAQQAQALCDGRIDATLYVVGHPSGAIKEALRDCDSRLLALASADVSTLSGKNPHYRSEHLNGGYYASGLGEIETAGVRATVISRADLPEQDAYAIVKALFERLPSFRRMHPAFKQLESGAMVEGPLAAPMHPGALRYFREAGLIP